MAAELRGKPAGKNEEKKSEGKNADPKQKQIHAVVVGDIDLLTDQLFYIRSLGRDNPMMDIQFDFDNVTFVLNILDELAGDTRFIEIRKHRPIYRTLEKIEEQTREARQDADKVREECMEKYENYEKETRAKIEKNAMDLNARKNTDDMQKIVELTMMLNDEQQKFTRNLKNLARDRDRDIEACERKKEESIRSVQTTYKLSAVLLPPILPLVVAFGVFIYRRTREREGVARSRLR
jgi:ABC-2 type transport system permease protein